MIGLNKAVIVVGVRKMTGAYRILRKTSSRLLIE